MAAQKKILVTGVAGFIGSNLADRLLRGGYTVIGIDNLSCGVREQVPSGVEFHKLDIRSKDIYPLFNGAKAVFHLAAKNCLLDCQKDPVETSDINITGTVNVFDAARRAKVGKVVYAESSAVYEKRALGFYAISKTSANLFSKGFQEMGLTTVGLRYFNVYGPRQDYRRTIPPVMSTFIIRILKGEPIVSYEGDEKNSRDFVYVDDVNDFHMLCINDSRVDNHVFDIGNGRTYTIADVLSAVERVIGEKAPLIKKPRPSDDPVVQTLADIAAAKRLGWEPKVSMEDGLREMVAYIK